jgi:hypothetical protein
LILAGLLVALVGGVEGVAQRVQFPSAAQPLPATPPSTFAAPPPTTSPFAADPVTPPLFGTAPAPAYGAPIATPSPYAVPATPSPIYTPPTYAAPPTTAAPITPLPGASPPPAATYPSTTAPWTTPAPPPSYSPTYPTTPFTAPSVGPPPPFDPYASGSPAGPPPSSVPYNYTPPPTNFPQQPSPLYPDGLPFQYQPGPLPSYPTDEGYYAKAQRFLQELSFEYTYLYGDHTKLDHLEINRAELSSTFAIPMFYNIETPLLVTPGFAANWLEGPLSGPPDLMAMPPVPGGPDLPPRLYDAYLDFAWYPKVTPWLGGELGFRTGVWSDFDHVDSDSVRFLGRGLASLSVTPNLDVLFGAVYLDRLNVKFLPAGGFYWRPTPEWDAYLVFPNPKVRKYWATVGNSKWYWYVAGEYGGGSWSVQRQVNSDRIDINDIRIIGGIEWETQTLIRGFVEAGYVWDREVLFQSGMPGEFRPDDTVMVRGGINF